MEGGGWFSKFPQNKNYLVKWCTKEEEGSKCPKICPHGLWTTPCSSICRQRCNMHYNPAHLDDTESCSTEILLEFRICPIFIDLTQIEGYRTDWLGFGCFVLRVNSNFEAVWGQCGLKNLLLCHYYSNTIIKLHFFITRFPMRPWMIYFLKYAK